MQIAIISIAVNTLNNWACSDFYTQLPNVSQDVCRQIRGVPESLGNYSGVHRGVPVVTIELPSALCTPTDADMRKMWQDLNGWLDRTLPVADAG